jgi:glc operon protein GlcG
MRMRYSMSNAEAQTILAAASARARTRGWPVTIAVVDDSGTLIALSRLDEATPASVETSIEKARSAALTGIATKTLESMVSQRPALVTLRRVTVEGGLPILHHGQRVGGIGVSGVRSDEDAEVAQAGFEGLIVSAE